MPLLKKEQLKLTLATLGTFLCIGLFITVLVNSLENFSGNKPTFNSEVSNSRNLTASVLLTSGGTSSELRNNFSGWVGFQFKVGSTPLTVRELGRYVVSGSSRTHSVKLVNGNGTDVSGGSVKVNTANVPAGTYAYAPLPQPITLQANTAYVLVSQEFENGDLWYHSPNNQITLTSDATPLSPAFALNNTTDYNFYPPSPQTFVPVNLVYTIGTGGTTGGASNVTPNVTPAVGSSNPPTTPSVSSSQPTQTGASLSQGLVAYYNFDSGSGSTVSDTSGNGNTGTLSNGPLSTSGKVGSGSLSFDGVDDFVNAGQSATLAPPKITVSFFAKSNVPPNQFDAPMGKSNGEAWTTGWGFFFQSATQIRFFIEGYNSNVAIKNLTAPATNWNHYVGTWDGATVKLYVNGVEGTSASYSGSLTTTDPFNIGRLGTNNYNWNGQIDDVRIYNRALSPSEIQSLFNLGSTDTNATSSVSPSATPALTPSGGTKGGASNVTPSVTPAVVSVTPPVSSNTSAPPTPAPAVPSATSASLNTLLISGGTTGTLRNNFSGWVGFQFKVGSVPLTVRELGRYVVSGSSQTHTVKLVNGNGTDISGGSAIVNTATVPAGTYVYASLPSPVTLQANTAYLLVSQEQENGDLWYNYANNTITLTNDATPLSVAWAENNTTAYNLSPAGNQTFGPVNLKYSSGASGGSASSTVTPPPQSGGGTSASSGFSLAGDGPSACFLEVKLNERRNESGQIIFSLLSAKVLYGSYKHLATPTYLSEEHQYKWEIASVGSYGFNSGRFLIVDTLQGSNSNVPNIIQFAQSTDTVIIPMLSGISYINASFTVTDSISGYISRLVLPPGLSCSH